MPERRHSPTRIDPRAPLVLDTRELGRRPGSMRTVQRVVAAPEGFGLDLMGVPPGTDLELDLRLEAVMEGVLVSGRVRTSATGECGRCLDPVTTALEVELQELYAYQDDHRGGPDSLGDADVEDDVGRLEGDFIDLEPRLRDAVLLALPLQPVCREDCPGLCATCGARLADLPPEHAHEEPDPRWGALAGLELGELDDETNDVNSDSNDDSNDDEER